MPMPNRQIVNGEPYRYAYQGEFAETDPETGKPAFELRIYDPRLGRWLTTDPYGEFASPYLAMGNRPHMIADPNGGCTDCSKCPSACQDLGISSIPKGSSIDYEFSLDQVFMRNDLASTMGDEVFLGDGLRFDVLSDFHLTTFNNWHSNNQQNMQDAHDFYMKSGAIVADNTLANLAFGSAGVRNLFTKRVTLYRGVNGSAGSSYTNALKGVTKPRGGASGHMDAVAHNMGKTANSAMTSWTTDIDVALNYAYRGSAKDGVLLRIRVPLSKTIKSKDLHKIQLIHKKSAGLVSESEVLLQGVIQGAKVKRVKF